MYEVSVWAIVAAGLASVILAFVWYHPRAFGAYWMRELNLSPELAERGKRRMLPYVGIAFVSSMLVAYVMSFFGVAFGVYDWVGAVELGAWTWVGFTAPTMLGMVLWEQKSIKYYLVVTGHWLVSFIAMALILFY